MTKFMVSVVIPASRPPAILNRCLESLARARTPAGLKLAEVLVVANGGDLHPEDIPAAVRRRLRGLRLIRSAQGSLGRARNLALREATGEILCFLDDDVAVVPDYFQVLEQKLRLFPGADAIGGPNRNFPDSPPFQSLVGHVLGSRFGAWAMRRRCLGYPQDSWTDERGLILCNLCVRRAALDEEGLRFDEELFRNEENLLLERLRRRGRRMLHSPELVVYHERRDSLPAFCAQCLASGRGRGQMTRRMPGSLRLIHLLPLVLAVSLPGALLWPGPFAPIAAAYLGLDLANSAFLALRKNEGWRGFLLLALLFPAAHLSYAMGLVLGLADLRPRKRRV